MDRLTHANDGGDTGHETWPPIDTVWEKPEWLMPPWGPALWRGMLCKCPSCGMAPIFDGYLQVYARCLSCGAPLGEMPADDAPPYIALLVMAHFIGVAVVAIFRFGWAPNMVVYGILLAMLIGLCIVVLRIAKGVVIAILLKLGCKREALG